MENKKIQRLVLKEDDILLIKIPDRWFQNRQAIRSLYTQIKKQIYPRKNKVLILSNEIDINVIGKDKIEEYITNIDIWELWNEEEDKEL